MLHEQHADRRQLGDLMAAEPATAPALINGELVPATTARVREVIDNLIDLVFGREPATGAAMPPCAPALRLAPSPAKSSLAFARASARRC
jgi:hypothetical protein